MLLMLFSCASFLATDPPPVVHVVVRGDTLGKLAKRHGVTVDQLRSWNGIEGDLIEVGQEIDIHTQKKVATVSSPRTRRSRKPRRGRPDNPDVPLETEELGPSVPEGLQLPSRKRCLSGPDGSTLGDQSSVASEGLSAAAIQQAMTRYLPRIASCTRGLDAMPQSALDLELDVGCDGRVQRVRVLSRGDWPDAHAACYVEGLKRAPFPAHALPDGDTFRYPLQMR